MKYETLSELAEAFRSGELKELAEKAGDHDPVLVVDNDMSYVYIGEQKVFEGGGPDDLIWSALALLGIETDEA